jgi:hypothetical protein
MITMIANSRVKATAWAAVACFAACMASAAVAGPMTYHITAVSPRCGQRGTTVEVTMSGHCLERPQEVAFYKPGIKAIDLSCEQKPGEYGAPLKCKFVISAECPLGEHPFRVRTATQLTTVATFHVTPFPVVDENEGKPNANDSRDTAMAVAPNVTVRGRIGNSAAGDVDLYKVPAVAGQRLSVEVDSVWLTDQNQGQGEFDTAVRILDEEGRELAANDDSALHVQDPVVSVKLPRDGHAFVEIRRPIFTPRESAYCVHIGTNRRPLAAYPPGGPAGKPLAVKLLGDPLGDVDETIVVPEATGTFEYFGDAPSALLLRSSPFPNVLEDPDAAETVVAALPAALNGIIEKPGDVDAFRVTVKKGERYRVRAWASALGSPLDPGIRILPAASTATGPGKPEVTADDATLVDRDLFGMFAHGGSTLKDSLDPSVIWEAKNDGEYLIEMTDANRAGMPTAVYRIEVEPAPDAVHTFLNSTAFYWQECTRTSGLALPQGNRWTVNVSLPPGQGNTFNGELEFVAHGLPAGVRLVSPKVRGGEKLWPVQFVADATATPGAALITLEPRPTDPAKKIASSSQQNLPFCSHSGGDAWRTVRLDKYILAVTEPAPFSIDIEPPTAALVRGGELAIPVKITRREGFDEPVEFQLGWVPAGLTPEPKATIPSGESESVLRISAAGNAPLGKQPLVVTATTTEGLEHGWYLGAGRVRVSSEISSLTVAEPFVELAARPESIRRGEKKKFAWSVRHKSPFEGKASIRLLGLPKGVSVAGPAPEIDKDSKEIAFEIEATDEALMGAAGGLSCEVMVRAAGQEIRQRTGNGTLRIDPRL